MAAASILAVYALGVFAMVGLVKALVHFSSTASNSTGPNPKKLVLVELLKVMLLHGQWLFIISNMVRIPSPATLTTPFQVLVGIWSSASGSSAGFECILPRDTQVPLAIQKLLICLLTPVGILCVVLALEAVLHRFQGCCVGGGRRDVPIRHQLCSICMSVVFLFLPMWLGTAFSMFTCVQLDQPAAWPYQAEAAGHFWVDDIGQQCSSFYHNAWALGLGIPLIALLCVALPAAAFEWRSRQQGKLQQTPTNHVRASLRVHVPSVACGDVLVGGCGVATGYRPCHGGFALGPYFQALVTQAVVVVVLVLLLWVRPFVCRAANTVAVQSATVLFLTVFAALTFLPYNNLEAGPVYGSIMGVVLLLVNVVFLGFTTWKLARSVDWTAVRRIISNLVQVEALSKARPTGSQQSESTQPEHSA